MKKIYYLVYNIYTPMILTIETKSHEKGLLTKRSS